MSARQLLEAFDRWGAARVPLVLVTVVETEGSTYTKAGHRILIAQSGDFQGLVSGGCLEGDLSEHAREVLASGRSQLLTYDLRGDHDELFGLGIGCNGLFRVLLQPLLPEAGYEPFATIAFGLRGDVAGATATVVESEDPDVPAGATAVTGADGRVAFGIPQGWQSLLFDGCIGRTAAARAEMTTEALDGRGLRVLYAPLRPLPRLLVLGAGLDAVPLVEIAARLGWRVTVADHRPASLARGDLGAAESAVQIVSHDLARVLSLERFSAVIVMTHHLDTDRACLAALARTRVPYVGLLGPPARRERLLAELGAAGTSLKARLRAPVGLPIRADSPESIALAILAEIHATLAGRVDLVTAAD